MRRSGAAGEPIYIGMDFNVGKMAGIVHVLRLGLPCAVTEIINAYDTPDMIRIIKERFWLYDGNDYRKVREIYIYPDASGDSRKSSNASTTDIAQLKQAGFNVVVNSSNPPVKDRVNSMNAMFCNANGERRYKVNVKRCPLYAESLEQQVWDEKGEPDKNLAMITRMMPEVISSLSNSLLSNRPEESHHFGFNYG